ncbi:conserved hypothetical protein [Shewanella sediminis HAW-EB3]|uniref:Uncharacterized protein n=1 Tax=Shewanella sediminis (strain HAW-EB3) TaxID=425104 RepID=A8FZQ4_SHESH|nr:hypothetical protein [Shewanella sediminis]ABV38327.1 conserved hypothetical protein [Shewanella sediminis HAW-EB3]
MNRLNQSMNEQGAFSGLSALSVQKVITVTALLLLLVAVQVSTQNVGDWFVFGLNILEVTEPLSEVSNVGANVGTSVGDSAPDFLQKIVMALVECVLD